MGAYWASRIEFMYNNPKEAINYLKKSSEYPETFYGKLAIKALGYDHKVDFELPKISEGFINWLSSQKAVKEPLLLFRFQNSGMLTESLESCIQLFQISII